MSAVEETLAWEAQWRPRAAVAALGGALCGVAGGLILFATTRGGPDEKDGFVSLPETLGAAAAGGEHQDTSLLVRHVDHLGRKLEVLTLSTALSVLGILGALGALTYLFRAARARNPQIGRAVGWSIAAALAMYPAGRLLGEMGSWLAFADFATAQERTADAARGLRSEGVAAAGLILETFGGFALALAFVLVSLNAMKVGLLTRFMGILGVVVGALVVLELDQPQFVRWTWLIFLGLLVAGRYPGGAPPAWETGRAEPWPTQQELRERRDALRAEHSAGDEDEEPRGEGELLQPGDAGYVPGAARRKRKKRR